MSLPQSEQNKPVKKEFWPLVLWSLKAGWKLLLAAWLPLGCALLILLAGAYCLVGGSTLFLSYINQCCLLWISQAIWIVWSGVVLTVGIAIAILGKGSWDYLLFWVSLCLDADWMLKGNQSLNPGQSLLAIRKKKASLVLKTLGIYFSLPAVPVLPVGLLILFTTLTHQEVPAPLWGLAILLGAVLGLGWFVSLFLFTYVFQILALSNESNWRQVYTRSVELVLKNPLPVVGMQIVVYILTNLLAPSVVSSLLRITSLTQPLDRVNHWILLQACQLGDVDLAQLPLYPIFSNLLGPNWLVNAATDLLIGTGVTLMLLPIGSCAFTALYENITQSSALSPQDSPPANKNFS